MQVMKLLLTVAFLVLVLVLVLVQWENVCVSGSDSVQCREEERLALLHINASISFPIHSLEGKWEGKECCQWERVTCDSITGHVTQLDLGISFDDDDWLDYYQDGSLLNATLFLPLRQLRSLSLSAHGIHNCTDGSGLETWANLTKLESLDFSFNNLDESIIYDLASITSLRKLNLKGNSNYNSDLPNINGLEKWSNLTKLEILDLSDNSLNGSIIYNLASVPSLRKLYLSGNHINNSLPNFNGFEYWSNLTKLEMLDLSFNQLNITMISSLAQVSSLRALYLDYNYMMGGSVPVKELSALNLEVVSLTGCLYSGSFPDLGHWSSLKALSLADNLLNETLTSEGLCRLKNIEELDLSSNNLLEIFLLVWEIFLLLS